MNDDTSDNRMPGDGEPGGQATFSGMVRGWFRGRKRARNGDSGLRDALEELIDEGNGDIETSIGADARQLIENILGLRDATVEDVMVPRADIVAIDAEISDNDLIETVTSTGHSRFPIFRDALDDVLGVVHVKDVLVNQQRPRPLKLTRLARQALFIAPSMRVLDLLLEMRSARIHLALVVDEYGGIDGLVTIEDLVEEIVGEIEDEFDAVPGPMLTEQPDGSLMADARVEIEAFEARVGPILEADEREDIHTLGGLVFNLAGRVPSRGEVIAHPSGLEFEVVDVDPRRIRRLRVGNLPPTDTATGD